MDRWKAGLSKVEETVEGVERRIAEKMKSDG
jgi:hypothetical protein